MVDERPASVLIVENEAIVATDLSETLGAMGYEPTGIAASADEALLRATERCPDIVLMDIRIRGPRDGIETAALLRERFDVPVVYLTAHADETTIRRARETQPHGYLMKPVSSADLRSAIEIGLHRHEMEKRLRERERWFSTTLHSISDAVIAVDPAGTVTLMNPTAELLTGVKSADAIGRPAREVVRLLDPAQPASPLDAVLATKQVVRIEQAPLYHASGTSRVIADSAAPVLDEDELLGAVMVFRDITEQKALQKQLELTDRLASLGTMAAGVAHEVNNPLSVVIANAAFIIEELEATREATPRQVGMLLEVTREIASAGARIGRIVSELQAFARPSPPPTSGETDVAQAARWAVRATAQEYRYRARVQLQLESCPRVALDETRLGQIFVNLLVNAAHAIAPGQIDRNSVAITASAEGSNVLIEVRDTGAGMPADVMKRIFEPFFTTKDVNVGTGLGLAICHGIVTSAGGRIEAESEPGRGSTFRIWLPAVQDRAPEPPAAPARDASRRGRILVNRRRTDDAQGVRADPEGARGRRRARCRRGAREARERRTVRHHLQRPHDAGHDGHGLLRANAHRPPRRRGEGRVRDRRRDERAHGRVPRGRSERAAAEADHVRRATRVRRRAARRYRASVTRTSTTRIRFVPPGTFHAIV